MPDKNFPDRERHKPAVTPDMSAAAATAPNPNADVQSADHLVSVNGSFTQRITGEGQIKIYFEGVLYRTI